ncbi:MAG: hypothetical protein ACYC99_11045 [Candidatus Geothermincolia bacterium]
MNVSRLKKLGTLILVFAVAPVAAACEPVHIGVGEGLHAAANTARTSYHIILYTSIGLAALTALIAAGLVIHRIISWQDERVLESRESRDINMPEGSDRSGAMYR